MSIQLKKAVRAQVKLRVGLIGPSGAGKTYSALLLARGMGAKTVLVDTEEKRGLLYANEFEYFYEELTPPFTPEKYIAKIRELDATDVDTIILDSISHEWFEILRQHDAMPGNSYTNWKHFTPRHEAFLNAILQSNKHIIATMRGKDQYVIEERRGKPVPKKVGVGAQQRDGFEYGYHVALLIDQETNIASAVKDNTHHFEGRFERVKAEDGAFLVKLANSGEAPILRPERTARPAHRVPLKGEIGAGKSPAKNVRRISPLNMQRGGKPLFGLLESSLTRTANTYDPRLLKQWAKEHKEQIQTLTLNERVALRKAYTHALADAERVKPASVTP